MASALGLLFGLALIVIGALLGLQWLSAILWLCLIAWLVLEVRERGREGVFTVVGVVVGIAAIALAFVVDEDWLTVTVMVLAVIGWLVLIWRDRRTA